MTADGFTLVGAPLRRVSSEPWDCVGTVLLHLDCRHTAVRQASRAPKERARCGWCRLRALGERKRRFLPSVSTGTSSVEENRS